MIYGYARCSTNEERQNIDRQIRDIQKLANEKIDKQNIYEEYESGTKVNRTELNKLLDKVKEGDTIVATEVSRITRSTKQLCEILELAKSRKLKLILGTFVVDCTKELDPMTEGMLKMMGVFSEIERNIISQRVKSGMENAKAKGKVVGRPEVTKEDIPANFYKNYQLYKDKKINVTDLSRLCGISRTTVYKYKKLIEDEIVDNHLLDKLEKLIIKMEKDYKNKIYIEEDYKLIIELHNELELKRQESIDKLCSKFDENGTREGTLRLNKKTEELFDRAEDIMVKYTDN